MRTNDGHTGGNINGLNANQVEHSSRAQRTQMACAYVQFLARQDLDVFLTLATNSTCSAATMRNLVKGFVGRVDRHHLGKHWAKKPAFRRTSGFFTMEKVGLNTHAHCYLKFKRGNQLGQRLLCEQLWNEVRPSGSLDFQSAHDLKGAIRYGFKEIKWGDISPDNLVWLSDFHGAKSKGTNTL